MTILLVLTLALFVGALIGIGLMALWLRRANRRGDLWAASAADRPDASAAIRQATAEIYQMSDAFNRELEALRQARGGVRR